MPYRWPHPWLVDEKAARLQQSRLHDESQVQYELRSGTATADWSGSRQHQPGQTDGADGDVYVGTLRDITAERAFAARESAVLDSPRRSAWPRASEVLAITLDECRLALDVHRVVAAVWPTSGTEPPFKLPESGCRQTGGISIRPFGKSSSRPVASCRSPSSRSKVLMPRAIKRIVAVLTGGGRRPVARTSGAPTDQRRRPPAGVRAGRSPRAGDPARPPIEAARETSLTLQHAMLAPTKLPSRLRGSLRAGGAAAGNRW